MKLKKYSYLIVLIVTLLIGINQIKADSNMCYYMSADKSTLVTLDSNANQYNIVQRENTKVNNNEPAVNQGKDFYDSISEITVSSVGDGCPKYIVYRFKDTSLFGHHGIFAFNDLTEAKTFAIESEHANQEHNGFGDWLEDAWHNMWGDKYVSYVLSYTNSDGTTITEEEFANKQESNGDGVLECDELFGSKDNPESLRYLINEILQYPKIIVPILIIVLGILDLAKAVVASKEDEMRKAQSTFIKRVLLGVVVFFVPVILDILMGLIDLAWEGLGFSTCGL